MPFSLTLDTPATFTVEPGTHINRHCKDFHPAQPSINNIYRDPATGLVMLQPSVFGRDWHQDIIGAENFRLAEDYWQKAKRSKDAAEFLTSVAPAGRDLSLIEIEIDVALVAIGATSEIYDNLVWAAESNVTLARDEGFALHYHGITDELLRKNNLLGVTWDNLQLHLSGQGFLRVYQWADRAHKQSAPTLMYETQLTTPSELLNVHGYLVFIPIPTYGLLVMNSFPKPATNGRPSNAATAVAHSILIPLASAQLPDETWSLFSESPIRLAINPWHPHLFAIQRITYPSAGTFYDAPVAPAYPPSLPPASTGHTVIKGAESSVTTSFRKMGDTDYWQPGDGLGIFKAVLTTEDPRRTPFLAGYEIAWTAVTQSRETTQHAIYPNSGAGKRDTLVALEWTDDEFGHFEGDCSIIIRSDAGRAIAERGDATFELRYSAPGESMTNPIIASGFAKIVELTPSIAGGEWSYEAHFKLLDLWERFQEWRFEFMPIFDNRTVKEAINSVLAAYGMGSLASCPDYLAQTLLPRQDVTPQSGFQYAVDQRDTGGDVINKCLVVVMGEDSEYRVRYAPQEATWLAEAKPRDTENYWTASPFSEDIDRENRVFAYMEGSYLTPEPPEANVIEAIGVVGKDRSDIHGLTAISAVAKNPASISDPTSADYLGRTKILSYIADTVFDMGELEKMARRLKDCVGSRAFSGVLKKNGFDRNLTCPVMVKVLDADGNQIGSDMWVKSRTVTVERIDAGDFGDQATTTLHLDSVWTGGELLGVR